VRRDQGEIFKPQTIAPGSPASFGLKPGFCHCPNQADNWRIFSLIAIETDPLASWSPVFCDGRYLEYSCLADWRTGSAIASICFTSSALIDMESALTSN
jgi:hypothetical protein